MQARHSPLWFSVALRPLRLCLRQETSILRIRTHAAAVLIVFLASCLALLGTPAHATGTHIDAKVSFSGANVRLYGTLKDDSGRPIKHGSVSATLGSQPVASAHPGSDGGFEINFPVPGGMQGNQKLVLRYSGHGRNPAATASATLALDPATSLSNPQQPPSPTPETASAPPPPPSTQLTVKPDLNEPTNGDFITITGKLVAPDGRPVTDAGILLFDPAGEVEEGYVVTDSNGAFTTHYELPLDVTGDYQLTLKFEGAAGIPAADAPVTLKVQHKEVNSASPTPSASESAEPAESATPEATASDPTPSAIAESEHIGDTPANPDRGFGDIMGWFVGGIAAVGGVSVVLAIVVFTRVRIHRTKGKEREHAPLLDEGGSFFDDEHDAPPPPAPRRAAH